MQQITYIDADIQSPYLLHIHEKQYDRGRWIYARIMEGSQEFSIPEGAIGVMKIRKPDGHGCVYDSEEIEVIEKSTTIQNGGISLDEATYLSMIFGAGERVFDFDGTNWSYNTELIDLEDYGIEITEGTPVNGDTITIVTEVRDAVIIDGNTVKVLLVDQALTAYGQAICEIELLDTESRIATFNFIMDIEKSAITDEEIASTGYINLLTEKLRMAIELMSNLPVIGNTDQVLTKTDHGFIWQDVARNYTGTLAAADWDGDAAPYTQIKSHSTVQSSDKPVVDIVGSGVYADDTNQEDAWIEVYRVEALNGGLKFYAKHKPIYAINYIARVVR